MLNIVNGTGYETHLNILFQKDLILHPEELPMVN